MNDQETGIIGELLNLFYREQYESMCTKYEELNDRMTAAVTSLDIERDRNRMLNTQIELLRSELVHMDQKFESYLMVFDRIFHFEAENVREPVSIYINQVHSVYGYMDEALEIMAEYETDEEFDLLMETLIDE